MELIRRTHLIYVKLAVYALTCIALLFVIDWSLANSLEKWRLLSLSNQSRQGISNLTNEVTRLQREKSELTITVGDLSVRNLPRLEDLKTLSGSHRLTFAGVDKINRGTNPQTDRDKYRIVLSGTVGRTVRFLKSLEDNYIFDPDVISLTPVDESGRTVYLDITLATRSS